MNKILCNIILGCLLFVFGVAGGYFFDVYANDDNTVSMSDLYRQDVQATSFSPQDANIDVQIHTDPLEPMLMKFPQDPYPVNNNFQQTLGSCPHYTPDQRITFKYFGSSSRYSQHRSENPCDPCSMKIVTIEPSQGLPEVYQDNTIYLLKAGDYYVKEGLNNYIKNKSCLAIVGEGEVFLKSQEKVQNNMIYLYQSQYFVLENLLIDGIPTLSDNKQNADFFSKNGLTIFGGGNGTINGLYIYNFEDVALFSQNTKQIVANSAVLSNSLLGFNIQGNNLLINNSLVLNNRLYGLYFYEGNNVSIQNSQIFNNRMGGFAIQSGNNLLLHNNIFYNNYNYEKQLCIVGGGILFLTKYAINSIISHTMLYNNSLWGIQLVDKINSSPIATYLGTVSYDSIHEADISYITPGMYDSVLGEGSLLQTGSLVMSCDMATQVGDYFAQYPQCDYQGDLTGWFYDSTMTITYGSGLPRQSIPLIYDTNGVLQTSSIPYDSTKSVGQF